ncbi:MAG TPA: sulfatase [Acidobacteriaceae bacterium]|nr:sulfatase [Acidobacteriaceae bacterium]
MRDKEDAVSRRSFLEGMVATGVAAQLAPLAAQAGAAASFRPNIVYLHSHDSGRYLEPYGAAAPTPHLARLAEQGTLFRNAFSAAPTCSPSRAALLTGMCAHSNGMVGLANRGFVLNDYRKVMVHTLRAAGYTSVLGGLQHIANDPTVIGYDHILQQEKLSAVYVAPAAAAFLDSRPAGPFFLDVGFFETHREFPEATAEDNADYCALPRPIPDTPVTRGDFARFRASARVMDAGAGQVLEALERNGYAENTLVLSTTDHGIAFPRMKCDLTDDGWGVSMMMRGPRIAAGAVCDALISQLDIFPTFCDYLGIERPAWLEGKSFLPVLAGQTAEINEEVFAEVNYHASYEPKRAVRTTRWKYIRRYGDRKTPVLPNCDDSPSKSEWLRAGWGRQILDQEGLYDLVFDPTEHANLIHDPGHREIADQMRGRLRRWMEATNDPLLHGRVAAPAGAVVNDPREISPREATEPADTR